jgi:hypothetical protein
MVSFLKDEEKKGSSLWDWVILSVLVLGALGFWWYYQGEQKGTLEGFEKAEQLFQAGRYQEALVLYQELQGADYLEAKHDSLLSVRLDTLHLLVEE